MGKLLLRPGTAYKNGVHACISSKMHIAQVITHHDGFGKIDLREIQTGPDRHTRIGLSFRMIVMDTAAIINRVNPSTHSPDFRGHVLMYIVQGGIGHKSAAHTALIGDNHDPGKQIGQFFKKPGGSLCKYKFIGVKDIAAVLVNIDHTITVQKQSPGFIHLCKVQRWLTEFRLGPVKIFGYADVNKVGVLNQSIDAAAGKKFFQVVFFKGEFFRELFIQEFVLIQQVNPAINGAALICFFSLN